MPRVIRLSGWTIALTVLLMALGGIVRATGAGLACPDWPLCHGRLIPPFERLVLIEWSHRFAASVVGVVVLLLVWTVWRVHSTDRRLRRLAGTALGLLLVQIILGGLTVQTALGPGLVAAHLATATVFLGTLLLLHVAARSRLSPVPPVSPGMRRAASMIAAAAFLQIVLGGYVSASGARLACPDFPLCRGAILPILQWPVVVHWTHRLGAVVLAVLAATLAARARGAPRPVRRLAAAAMGLLILQITLGAVNVLSRTMAPVTVAHLITATAFFGVLAALVGITRAAPVAPLEQPRRAWLRVAGDYVALTKPRIIVLLLGTTVTTMVIAGGGSISAALVVYTLLGGTLASGAANAINCYWDRDVDAVMRRTRRRPVPAGRVPPGNALAFGVALGIFSLAVLGPLVNWASAALALGGLLFYVFVYTMWLKRTTPQNIVIGGAAGAVPPLVAWAAVTGRVEAPAVLLFLIIFLWTPPHFWALALNRRQDYAEAHIPMLPVVAGEAETRRQILRYSVAMVVATLMFVPVAGGGTVYLAAALMLGGIFLYLARHVARGGGTSAAWRLFGYSIAYLMLLFVAMAVDRLV